MHKIVSKLELLCENSFIKKINETISSYNDFVDIHYSNKPKKNGAITLISSNDKPDREKEDLLWKKFSQNIEIITEEMKNQL